MSQRFYRINRSKIFRGLGMVSSKKITKPAKPLKHYQQRRLLGFNIVININQIILQEISFYRK